MVPTRNHDDIRQWAEANDGIPAEIAQLKFDHEPTVLHFLFGQAKAGTPELRPITWEDFFARFDLLGLSIAYDDDTPQFDIVHVDATPELGTAN